MGQVANCISCQAPNVTDISSPIGGPHDVIEKPPAPVRARPNGEGVCHDRCPMWDTFKGSIPGAAPATVAARTLRWMLDRENFNSGQRRDLERISSALDGMVTREAKKEDKMDENKTDGGSSAAWRAHMSVDLDDSVKAFILDLGGGHRLRPSERFRAACHMVIGIIRTRRAVEAKGGGRHRHGSGDHIKQDHDFSTMYGLPTEDDVRRELDQLDSWSEFDVFKISRLSSGLPLRYVGMAVMEKRGLIKRFNISTAILRSFLIAIETGYEETNPYHNAIHAADVTQTTHVLLRLLRNDLPELETLSMLFAAICHDVGHPGVTNDFRQKSRDDGAITYNDLSVNENMHCAIAYRVLRTEENDFLNSLVSKQQDLLRKMVVDMILATDMARHASGLKELNKCVNEKGPIVSNWESTQPALDTIVHGADLSNVCKPKHIAFPWSDRVLEEFFAQGDQERLLLRPVSPLCDRKTVSKPGSQVGFIGFVVQPLMETLANICDVSEGLGFMKEYRAHWQRELEAEKEEKRLKALVS